MRILYTIVTLFFSITLSYGASISLVENEALTLPLSQVKFHTDSIGSDIYDALEHQDQFKHIENTSFLPDTDIWGYFYIKKVNKDIKDIWFVEFLDAKIDQIEFYEIKVFGKIKQSVGGDNSHNFRDREILYNNSSFPITLGDNEESLIFFKINNSSDFNLNILISPYKTFIESAVTKYHIIGIFFGTIFFTFLLVLGQIIFYRQTDLLLFLLYLVGLILLFLTYDNFGFHYVWHSYPFINDKGFEMSILIYIVMQALFLRKFLDSSFISPLLDNIVIATMLCRVLIYTTGNFISMNAISELSIDTLTLSILLFVAIKMYFKKHDLARFVIISLIIQLVTFALVELCQKGLFKSNFILDYGFQLGTTIAMLLYSMAIMDKIRFSNVFIVDEKQESPKK